MHTTIPHSPWTLPYTCHPSRQHRESCLANATSSIWHLRTLFKNTISESTTTSASAASFSTILGSSAATAPPYHRFNSLSLSFHYQCPLAKSHNLLLHTLHQTSLITTVVMANHNPIPIHCQMSSITTTLAIHTTKAMQDPMQLWAAPHILIHTILNRLPISLFKKGVVCLGRKNSCHRLAAIICRRVDSSRWEGCYWYSNQEEGSTMPP